MLRLISPCRCGRHDCKGRGIQSWRRAKEAVLARGREGRLPPLVLGPEHRIRRKALVRLPQNPHRELRGLLTRTRRHGLRTQKPRKLLFRTCGAYRCFLKDAVEAEYLATGFATKRKDFHTGLKLGHILRFLT